MNKIFSLGRMLNLSKYGLCLLFFSLSIIQTTIGQVVPALVDVKQNKAKYQVGIGDGMKNELQPYLKRSFNKRRLEPKNFVVHGVGQSHNAYLEYGKVMKATTQPSMYMVYHNLNDFADTNYSKTKIAKIIALPSPAIPQLGLAMTTDGKPEKHYEQDVAAGLRDKEITNLINFLKKLDRPIYIRLGYEFNGHWNGYQAKDYIAAYQHVAKAIRKAGLEKVALVWCFAVDGDEDDFMKFYPGDQYVDWWSVDVFSAWHFEKPELWNFIDSAKKRNYPVMIGECTPRRISVYKGDSSWRLWYVPFFNMIRRHPNLKAISYINWNWEKTPWPDWGDGRIEAMPEPFRSNYLQEISQPWFLHSNDKGKKFILKGITN